ncbi:MAG: hypothetical protein JSS50_03250 [Proteobacteria bacterium]|nr:hypothetical protein [Pseudomonadota bacterium]
MRKKIDAKKKTGRDKDESSEEVIEEEKPRKKARKSKAVPTTAQEEGFESQLSKKESEEKQLQSNAKVMLEGPEEALRRKQSEEIKERSTALQTAVAAGDLEKVKQLTANLPKGFNINACTPPYTDTKEVNVKGEMKTVPNDKDNAGDHRNSLLMTALLHGRADIFQYLVEECGADIVKSVDGRDQRFDGQKVPFGYNDQKQLLPSQGDKAEWSDTIKDPEIAKRMAGVVKILGYIDQKTDAIDAQKRKEATTDGPAQAIKSSKDEISLLSMAFFYMDEPLFNKIVNDPSLDHNPPGARGDVLRNIVTGYAQASRGFGLERAFKMTDKELHLDGLSPDAHKARIAEIVLSVFTHTPERMGEMIERFGVGLVSANMLYFYAENMADTQPEHAKRRDVVRSVVTQLVNKYPDDVLAIFDSVKNAGGGGAFAALGFQIGEGREFLALVNDNLEKVDNGYRINRLGGRVNLAEFTAKIMSACQREAVNELSTLAKNNAEIILHEIQKKGSVLNKFYLDADPEFRAQLDEIVAQNLQVATLIISNTQPQPMVCNIYGYEAWKQADHVKKAVLLLESYAQIPVEHRGLWTEQFKLFFSEDDMRNSKTLTEAILKDLKREDSLIEGILENTPLDVRYLFFQALQQNIKAYGIEGDVPMIPQIPMKDWEKADFITKAKLVLSTSLSMENDPDAWRKDIRELLNSKDGKGVLAAQYIAEHWMDNQGELPQLTNNLSGGIRKVFMAELANAIKQNNLAYNITEKDGELQLTEKMTMGKFFSGLGALFKLKTTPATEEKQTTTTTTTTEKRKDSMEENWTAVDKNPDQNAQQASPPEKAAEKSQPQPAAPPTTMTATTTTHTPIVPTSDIEKATSAVSQTSAIQQAGHTPKPEEQGTWVEKSRHNKSGGNIPGFNN